MDTTSVALLTITIGFVATGVSAASILKLGTVAPVKYTTLAEESFLETSPDFKNESLFGGKYKSLMVSPSETNRQGGLKSYQKLKKNKYKKKIGERFKVTKTFFDIKGIDALNRICKKVYMSPESSVTTDSSNQDLFQEEDVGKYCSFLEGKPKTVFGAKEKYDDIEKNVKAIGQDQSNSLIAINVNSPVHKRFGASRQKEFFKSFPNVTNKDQHKFFKSFYVAGNIPTQSIREHCGRAYQLSSAGPIPTKDEVVAYCSLKDIVPNKVTPPTTAPAGS